MIEIEYPNFTRVVKYDADGEYKIAHGLTQSNEQCGNFTRTASDTTR